MMKVSLTALYAIVMTMTTLLQSLSHPLLPYLPSLNLLTQPSFIGLGTFFLQQRKVSSIKVVSLLTKPVFHVNVTFNPLALMAFHYHLPTMMSLTLPLLPYLLQCLHLHLPMFLILMPLLQMTRRCISLM